MGIVYRAWHLRLDRAVALKMLLAGAYARPEERDRFLREAQAVAALRHPNIVQVHDAGEVDGRPYFTMELVEGGDLADQIQGVPQPARQAADLVATIADAVHTAHESGIVHRDLKPNNILLTEDGTPKVTDFGLARRMEGDGELTFSGAPLGTPSYMAPEQARGDKGAIGPATDVYALGAILYELLTGRPPFRADTSDGDVAAGGGGRAGVARDGSTRASRATSKRSASSACTKSRTSGMPARRLWRRTCVVSSEASPSRPVPWGRSNAPCAGCDAVRL